MKASKAEIAVFVSGGGTNLQALIDAQKSGIIKHGEIKLVVSSNPNAYALERAAKAGFSHFADQHGGNNCVLVADIGTSQIAG